METIKFAENLKSLRKEKKVSQAELAKRIDVSTGIISLWESGKREPTMRSLIALSVCFGVTLDALVGFNAAV